MKKTKLVILLVIVSTFIMPKSILAETFDGEYSIDYLLRNYGFTLLNHNNDEFSLKIDAGEGDVFGSLLVNGNIRSNNGIYVDSTGFNSNSYVSGNIIGDYSFNAGVISESNYIDFAKLYNQVVLESNALAENTEYHINEAKPVVTKPGIYTVDNMARFYYNDDSFKGINNSILIKNYDKDSLYVFNYYNQYIDRNTLPNIDIMIDANSMSLYDYIVYSGEYTGNIIFNFPNAKSIFLRLNGSYVYGMYDRSRLSSFGFAGSIIAPKATIIPENNFDNFILGSIVADKIMRNSSYYVSSYVPIGMGQTTYKIDKKVIEEKEIKYVEESKDYDDDVYARDYSISDLLKNYSLVTLGHKDIDSKSSLLQFGNTPGSIKMFHITGQALIEGDIYGNAVDYNNYDKTAFDLESNEVTESYIKGNIMIDNLWRERTVIQPWDNMNNDNITYVYQKNNLFVNSSSTFDIFSPYTSGPGLYTSQINNYLNFDRLYDNIVAEQAAIEEEKTVKVGEDGVLHLIPGCNYVIEDISNVKEIVFDQFEKEKDELTIITIKNSGDINFPLISKSGDGYEGIVTNDYYGKEAATHLYEQDTFVQDSYHGNIVWNVPNATYIKLKENAPFAGHLIAPNADVETPETHFAGCFIVNSIYGEGNTEAHFYPITANLKCDCDEYNELTPTMKKKFSEYRLSKLLGGEATTIEKTILGDEVQYREDIETLENIEKQCPSNGRATTNPIVNILTNPKTYRNIGLIVIISSLITYFVIVKRKKDKKSL